MSMSPHHHAISPPTPAPSPQPALHTRTAGNQNVASTSASTNAAVGGVDAALGSTQLLKHLSLSLPVLSQSDRIDLLSELVNMLNLRDLAHLSTLISPLLKVDFLSALPIEVSLHVLSFIDDPTTLARASCVSRFWRSLVNDEHTWKVMCLKHKFRRRGSIASSDRFLKSLSTPRLSSRARLQPNTLRKASIGSIGTPLDSIKAADDGDDNDAAILASLYQRYRNRGLDPSNALHELRTLHDLFLSKQDGGPGTLTDQMSENERIFYAQLEEIVEEESLARYGDQAAAASNRSEVDAHSNPASSPLHGTQQMQSQETITTPHEPSSQSSHFGLLSAGSSNLPPLPRILPNTAAISSSIRSADGRLDRLNGWQASSSYNLRSGALGIHTEESRSDTAMEIDDKDSRPSRAEPVLSNTAASLAQEGNMQPPGAPLLASLSRLESPTSRFSQASSSRWDNRPLKQEMLEPGPSLRRPVAASDQEEDDAHLRTDRAAQKSRSHGEEVIDADFGMVIDGANIAAPLAPMSATTRSRAALLPSLPRRDSSPSRSTMPSSSRWQESAMLAASNNPDQQGENSMTTFSAGSPAARNESEGDTAAERKRNRRRSAPLSQAATSGIKREYSSPFSSHPLEKSATTSGTERSSSLPFSYRTHFKLAYLTEANWRRGGRLQTQHVSADADQVVTSLAIDSEWIVVGMANSKIHVFSAETGLYTHTLLGHDAGVWCLTLISRTNKKSKLVQQTTTAEASNTVHGKGKMVITDPEDGFGGKPYQATADGDLRLVVHDPRPDAVDVLLSPGSQAADINEKMGSVALSSAMIASGSKSRQVDGDDETLEWFHKARRAMLRQAGSRRPKTTGTQLDDYLSGQADSDTSLSMRSEDVSGSSRSNASFAKARAVAEAEAGAIRDAVMSDGSGQVPAHLAESIRGNSEAVYGRESERGTPPRMPSGNALGLGNPCGSVLGYGNEDAIVVSGGCDRDVRVWDLKTGVCKYVLHGHTSTVRCLKVLDGKPIAVSGSRDSTLRVWNVETGEHLHLLAGHHHSVRCIEVAGNKVASGSYDGACRIWDLDTGECLHELRGHLHYIYAVAFDGHKVATGSLDSTVRVWSVETGECLALFQGHTSLVGQLQLLDNTLVTGGSDGRVIVFDLQTYACLHRLCAHDNSVTCLQFDDRYIITGGNDGRVKLWDFATGKFIRELCEPCEQVWKVSYRDDKVVVLCKRAGKTCMDVISFRPPADAM